MCFGCACNVQAHKGSPGEIIITELVVIAVVVWGVTPIAAKKQVCTCFSLERQCSPGHSQGSRSVKFSDSAERSRMLSNWSLVFITIINFYICFWILSNSKVCT